MFDTTQYINPWSNKRNSITIFKDTLKFAAVKKKNHSMALEVNRNIIGALLSYSAKSGRAIEIKL